MNYPIIPPEFTDKIHRRTRFKTTFISYVRMPLCKINEIIDINDDEQPFKMFWSLISLREDLTEEFIDKHLDKLDWRKISDKFSLQFIEDNAINYQRNNKYKNIGWKHVSDNPNLTMDFVRKYCNKPWDYKKLSDLEDLDMNFVKENIYEEWDFHHLSRHPNLTMDIVKDNIDEEWDLEYLSTHPKLTIDIVDKLWYRLKNKLDCRNSCFDYTKLYPILSLDFIRKWPQPIYVIHRTHPIHYGEWNEFAILYIEEKVFKAVDDVLLVTDLAKLVLEWV